MVKEPDIVGVATDADELTIEPLFKTTLSINEEDDTFTMEFERALGGAEKLLCEMACNFLRGAVVYRNGIHTTVKWGDGTFTMVKCGENDSISDELAFEAALAKKVFGSRTKFLKFLENNIVDVEERKLKKKAGKIKKKYGCAPHDGWGCGLRTGDWARVDIKIPEREDCKYSDLQGKEFEILGFFGRGEQALIDLGHKALKVSCEHLVKAPKPERDK